MQRKEKDLIPRTFAYLYIFAAQTGNGCCQEAVVQKNISTLECGCILHSRLVVACRAIGPVFWIRRLLTVQPGSIKLTPVSQRSCLSPPEWKNEVICLILTKISLHRLMSWQNRSLNNAKNPCCLLMLEVRRLTTELLI
jgi:hypothetical protein